MAAKNKENLLKLLEFLDKSILNEKENQWFVEELRKRITPVKNNSIEIESKKLNDIERYLGLDYNLDKENSPIDYYFLGDELQKIAESDQREMLRFKLGLRGHQKNFAEFCRYALLQAELLLNFYYDEFYEGDIEKIKESIKNHDKKNYYTESGREKIIEDIPFNTKLWSFYFANNFEGVGQLDNIRKIRNALSHRSVQPNHDEIFRLRQRLNKAKAKFYANGNLDTYNTPKAIVESEDGKAYRYEMLFHLQPYNEIQKALKSLRDKVFDLLKELD